MTESFGPHLEKLWAVAATHRIVAAAGERAAAEVAGSQIHLFDRNGRPTHAIDVDAPVFGLAFLFDDVLVAGTGRGQVLGFSAGDDSPALLFTLDAHRGPVRGLVSDRLQTRLWSVGDDGALVEFRLEGHRLAVTSSRALSEAPLLAVAIDPDERWLAAGGEDGQARLLTMEPAAEAAPRVIPVGQSSLCQLLFTTDGRLVVGGGDGSLRLVYVEGDPDEEDRSQDSPHGGAVRGLVLGPQLFDEADRPRPRRLFSVGEDGALKVWPIDSRRKPSTIELGSSAVRGLIWIEPPASAGVDDRPGGLVAVDAGRHLTFLKLDGQGKPVEERRIVRSRLERLAKDLSAPSDQVRNEAVESLGAIPEAEARRSLERALQSDRSPDVRARAAHVLGHSGRRVARPALRAALADDDESVRFAALAGLEALEAANPLSAPQAGLSSPHEDVRRACIEKLPALRSASPTVPGLIADALNDTAVGVRMAALAALHALEPKPAVEPRPTVEPQRAIEPTRVAYGRGPADIREAALERLVRSGGASVPEGRALLESALDDDAGRVRSAAFLLVVATQPRLTKNLRRLDKHFDRAVENLERGRPFFPPAGDVRLSEEDRGPLFAALACRHPDTALRGAAQLARIGDRRATGAILQLSREGDEAVRRLALDALLVAAGAFPGDDRIRARVEWMLDDDEASLRARAFEGLKALTDDAGPQRLELAQVALGASRGDIRAAALSVIVDFGGEGRFEDSTLREVADRLLGEALDDEDPTVRTEAFRTLWAWNRQTSRVALERGARSRQADIRKRVAEELEHQDAPWVRDMLLVLVGDSSSDVGLTAYKILLKTESNQRRSDVHLAALRSPRPEVRAYGCEQCKGADPSSLRTRLYELVDDDRPQVHLRAIEAVDALLPDDPIPYARAFDSLFYELRVRAAELLARRRKDEAVRPMRALLTIPARHYDRPTDGLRQRAAAAIADVGDPNTIPFLVALLDDDDPIVRENAARGLATACRGEDMSPLVDALAHGDLPVRSWAAEGLARFGDLRAVPVLIGTLQHPHRPIREGAIIGLVALGPDGARGLQQGLEDPDRTLQDLALAVIVARDVALARVGLAPDLLLTALSASHPEIRFAAARVLQTRDAQAEVGEVAKRLVGPLPPQKASETKDWPSESAQAALLNVLVSALASDHPAQRYAAARVLSRRAQPKAFWREAERLARPSDGDRPWVPRTGWDEERVQPRKRDWVRRIMRPGATETPDAEPPPKPTLIRRLFGAGDRASEPPFGTPPSTNASTFYRIDIVRLVFGAYAGLVRQAPDPADSDETHRVRRDSITQLAALAQEESIGRGAVLPILRRALSDPHHLVRKAAVQGLRAVYPPGSVEPLGLSLESSAPDVGRAAVDELVDLAGRGSTAARMLALRAIEAPAPEVRRHAVGRLQNLFDPGSIEPWFLALESTFADVRLSVVERLAETDDDRVTAALGRALESDHDDLRLKAALALAKKGDVRTLDVLAAFLRSEDAEVAEQALGAVTGLAAGAAPEARKMVAARAAEVVANRLEDDPDQTANPRALMRSLGRIQSPEAAPTLLAQLAKDDPALRRAAFQALVALTTDTGAPVRVVPGGAQRKRYRESVLLGVMNDVVHNPDPGIRMAAADVLRDVDDPTAEAYLAQLLEDRESEVRVRAAERFVDRLRHVESATTVPLERALRRGRRELVLPAALGLAHRGRREAFQPLMLVFKAGAAEERRRAVLGLGTLADARALEELYRLVDDTAELTDDDAALAPAAAEAFGAVLPALTDPEARAKAYETLHRLAVEGPDATRTGALAGLRRSADPKSRALLQRIVADVHESSELRRTAIGELSQLGAQDAEAVLADALNANDRRLRQQALAALKKIFPRSTTRVSLLALQSRHDDIAQPAAVFLAQHGEPEILIERLPDIDDARVRGRVRRGLIRRRAYPATAISPLLGADRPEPRAEAAWLAGASADPTLADPVRTAASRSAAAWRKKRDDAVDGRALEAEEEAWLAALWAAGRVDADLRAEARAVLETAGGPTRVQTQALRYLGRNGRAEDAPAVESALSAGRAEVRQAAAAALARLAPERGATVLQTIPVADPAAVEPLLAAGWPDKARSLLADDGVRPLALSRALGGARAVDLIAVARSEGEGRARLSAIGALGRIGGEDAEACLASLLSDGEPDPVRAVAFKALRRAQRAGQVRFDETQDQDRGPRRTEEAAASDEDLEDPLDDDEDEDFDEDDDEDEDFDDDDEDEDFDDDEDDEEDKD